jgi:hypothetical protein
VKSRSRHLLLVLLVAFPRWSSAQAIDAKAVFNALLAQKPPVHKTGTRQEGELHCHPVCHGGAGPHGEGSGPECSGEVCTDTRRTIQFIYTAPSQVASLHVVKVSELKFGAPVLVAIPERFVQKSIVTTNCFSAPIHSTPQSLAISDTLTTTISVTQSISDTQSTTVTGTLKVGGDVLGLGASLQRTVTVGLSETQSKSTSETVTATIATTAEEVAPHHELTETLRFIEKGFSVPFTASVVFDGGVDLNLDGRQHLSDVLTEAQRTLEMKGSLATTASSDASLFATGRALTPQECPASPAKQKSR